MSSQVYIDDPDASLVYSGNWESTTQELRAYHNTLHLTNSTNSRATLTFSGINIMVYGAIRAMETSKSSYSIDGADPIIFTGTASVLSSYSSLFYTSPVLHDGQHNLVITNLNNGTEFFLDYFVAVTTSATSTATSSPTAVGTIPSASSISSPLTNSSVSRTVETSILTQITPFLAHTVSGSSIIATSGTSSITNDTGTFVSNKSQHLPVIIGSVAASAIFLFFGVAICIWLRRRRRYDEADFLNLTSLYTNGPRAPVQTSMTTSMTTSTPVVIVYEEPPGYASSEPPAYDGYTGAGVQIIESRNQNVAGLKGMGNNTLSWIPSDGIHTRV